MKHSTKILLFGIATMGLLAVGCANQGTWLDQLGLGRGTNAVGIAALSEQQIVAGLKEALGKGVNHAVTTLGRPDGFLKDLTVRIPLPESLQRVDRTLRSLGQDQLADEFQTSMNRAAERAAPEAASVLANSIQQMTLADARAILTGSNNAATAYFRRTSETNLYQRFYPIVGRATQEVGVTEVYKRMLGKISFAAPLLAPGATDLDGFVTQKALEGMFVKIADEEKRIRQNPLARTTELLQRVFGAVAR